MLLIAGQSWARQLAFVLTSLTIALLDNAKKKTGLTSHRNVSQLFTKNHLDKNSNAKNVKNISFFSLQVHNETYDGFRRLSATFEELEERVNASDTDDEDVDDSEDIR